MQDKDTLTAADINVHKLWKLHCNPLCSTTFRFLASSSSPKVGDFNRGWDLDPLWRGRLHRLQTLSIHPLFPCLLKCGDSSSPGSIIQNMPTALWLSERLGKRLCTYIFLCARRLFCLQSLPGSLPCFHFLLFWHTQGRSKGGVWVSNIVHHLIIVERTRTEVTVISDAICTGPSYKDKICDFFVSVGSCNKRGVLLEQKKEKRSCIKAEIKTFLGWDASDSRLLRVHVEKLLFEAFLQLFITYDQLIRALWSKKDWEKRPLKRT